MTEGEKMQMEERNKAICEYHSAGHTLAECGLKFGLGKQRILQILQRSGTWTPRARGKRTKHLGVTVTEETKDAIERAAYEHGKSVSRFASEVLEAAVATANDK
jgi:hypothetical protein